MKIFSFESQSIYACHNTKIAYLRTKLDDVFENCAFTPGRYGENARSDRRFSDWLTAYNFILIMKNDKLLSKKFKKLLILYLLVHSAVTINELYHLAELKDEVKKNKFIDKSSLFHISQNTALSKLPSQ